MVGWVTAAASAASTFDQLVEQADAIVLVVIRSVDTSAMPVDGPMQVDAKVAKVVKGRVAQDAAIRFAASAWMGPRYQPDERRIVFLARSDAEHMAGWSSIEVGWLDLFFTEEALDVCSLDTLAGFLRSLERQPSRPRLQFRAHTTDTREHLVVPDNDRFCRDDSDCVFLPTHCGGCTCGTAIHRRWEVHYQDAFHVACDSRLGPVCDMHCPEQVPRCIEGRCLLTAVTR
ncbi:MAG: hypothetical protein HYT88_03485 [Candidatus Omnitrophica bacterium]|nr:hypothetical protein [Candidatus Omnitrophota bacterium]